MTMLKPNPTEHLDLSESALMAGEPDLAAENEALRAYLARVLDVLETRVDQPTAPIVIDHPHPVFVQDEQMPRRLTDLEAGVRRIEASVGEVLDLLSGLRRSSATSVD